MRIAIISGASAGIGKAFVKELDSLGLDELWLIGRNKSRLEALQGELSTKSRCLYLDLTVVSSFSTIASCLSIDGYCVEYLIASAGVGYTGAVGSNTAEEIASSIDLNCRGLTLLINTVLPFMSAGGKILTVASGAGFLPQPDFAVYAATKSYVISLSRALRCELKPKKITVTALCPGPVDTEFFSGLKNVKEYKKKYLVSPERVAKKGVRAMLKGKAICTPTLSMKLLRLCTKILPTSLTLKFTK